MPPMSSLVKKSKKPSLKKNKETPTMVLPPTPEPTPNPSLPDDLLPSCFARVSRLYYPTLSLVSKSFPSLLASPEIYKIRSSLGRSESCLYVCISSHRDPIPRWFTLCRKPDRTLSTNDTMQLKKKKKHSGNGSGYALAKLVTSDSRLAQCSGVLVTVGSHIYNIGETINEANQPSSSVSILDCRSNTWSEGPSMLVKRNRPFANVIDGKIYVTGYYYSQGMEVFDPKTQTWELVPTSPAAEIRIQYDIISTSAGVDGKVYIFGFCNGLAYDTREGRWESVGTEMSSGWLWHPYCVVDNVLYYYHEGTFKWFDTKVRRCRVLKLVHDLPHTLPHAVTRLADYGGKMAVLWDRSVAFSGLVNKMIWCAVIALERHDNDQEIWGKVEWSDAVLEVPESCRIERALAATF